jgi:RNA polymerase sigma-70 factor, ECF subfamily
VGLSRLSNANGQPAAAAYRRGENGAYEPFAIVALTRIATGIARITLFAEADLFAKFDLPQTPPNVSRPQRGS